MGALLPLTGKFSSFATYFENGLNLALDQANHQAGGKHVKLIIEDTADSVTTATTEAHTLVGTDHVSMMIGPFDSSIMAALAPYYKSQQVPAFGIEDSPIEVGQSGWVFVPQGSLAQISYPTGEYAATDLHLKTATLVGTDYIAGWRIMGGFAKGYRSKGGKVIQAQWAPTSATDFSSYFGNLKQADALVSWFPGTQATFLHQQFSFHAKGRTVLAFGNGLTNSQLASLGKPVVGAVTSLQYVSGLNTPASKAFVSAYQAKYHTAPTAQNDEAAYEDGLIVLEALRATHGSTEPTKLVGVIRGMKLNTPAGPVTIDPQTGFGIRNFYILRAEQVGGAVSWVPVKTYTGVRPIKSPPSKGSV